MLTTFDQPVKNPLFILSTKRKHPPTCSIDCAPADPLLYYPYPYPECPSPHIGGCPLIRINTGPPAPCITSPPAAAICACCCCCCMAAAWWAASSPG